MLTSGASLQLVRSSKGTRTDWMHSVNSSFRLISHYLFPWTSRPCIVSGGAEAEGSMVNHPRTRDRKTRAALAKERTRVPEVLPRPPAGHKGYCGKCGKLGHCRSKVQMIEGTVEGSAPPQQVQTITEAAVSLGDGDEWVYRVTVVGLDAISIPSIEQVHHNDTHGINGN
eukprot:478171-Amphidinium_carterae.3